MNAFNRGLTLICCGAALALGTGCQDNNSSSDSNPSNIRFSVAASNSDIVVGDTVTFTTRSENTLGRDARVKWTSTGGELDTDEGGRIARATFNAPGTYTVTGRLEIDGQATRTDSVDVRVKSVR